MFKFSNEAVGFPRVKSRPLFRVIKPPNLEVSLEEAVILGSIVDSNVKNDSKGFVTFSELGHGSIVNGIATFRVLLTQNLFKSADNSVCIFFK